MKILVTGATGYIGRELVKELQNKYECVVLVRDTSITDKLIDINCKIIKFNNYEEIIGIFEKENINGVVHLASNVVVEHNLQNINSIMDSNITYGTFLLEACKHTNVKWFINTGTFWQNYHDEEYNPVNLYAASKEAFETIAKYYTETSDIIFTTIKLCDTFGPNDTRPKIFNLWNKVTQTGEVLNMSPGEQIIDISYIEDIINAYELLIRHLNSDNKIQFQNKTFAVKSNERMRLKDLAKVFEEATHTNLNINWGARVYREREVMVPWEENDTVPGWEPKYSLKDAIQKTLGID